MKLHDAGILFLLASMAIVGFWYHNENIELTNDDEVVESN